MARSPVQDYLERLHAEFAGLLDGAVADYIPPLASADPDRFGICLATTDGHVYEVGDTRVPFTIQSMSKPFTYGLALADRGRDAVMAKVGVEPSGDAFNSISLAPGTGRPRNPMINAGAITAAALVAGATSQERFARVLDAYGRYAGRPLDVDEAVFASERDTGHRNRAIGHMLRSFDVLEEDPETVLERYFRQCSVLVDCRDVALMAATLANGGEQPRTGERALAPDLVDRVLSVMTTCGMYDGAGEWVEGVGMPAKSGVAGGILAVLPGELGVAVFSPRLDEHGNSVRGVAVCRRMSADLSLHFLHATRSHRSAIRGTFTAADVPSRRRRPPAEREVLDAVGARAEVLELQGDLLFAGMEAVMRRVVADAEELDVVVLDLRGVGQLDVSAAELLVDLRDALDEVGVRLGFVEPGDHPELLGALMLRPGAECPLFGDPDAATEWAENVLLADRVGPHERPASIDLADHHLAAGLDAGRVARLAALLERRTYAAGERIMAAGDPADEIFLVIGGEVTVLLPLGDGGRRRLATLTPGLSFGELAVLGHAVRAVEVVADGEVELAVLGAGDFHALHDEDPGLQAALLRNMLAGAYDLMARTAAEATARR